MKKLLAVLFACAAIAHAGFAEEKEEPSILGKALDEVLVPFDELLAPSFRLDPIIVTPSRYYEPSLNVSKSVTVISEDAIRDSHARYVPELLERVVGVSVRDYVGNGKSAQVDVRGFGESAISNVLVLVDGRRTNQIDITGADWAQIDVDSIEKIEVVRGPQTVLYGDNATGGVINIITKSGKAEECEIGVKYQTGSYRYNSVKGHIQGGHDFLDYYGFAAYSYNNGYRINNHLETIDYNANFTVKPTDYFAARFYGGYHRDWYGLPGALSSANLNLVGRKGSAFPNDRARTEDFYFMFGPDLTYDFGLGDVGLSWDTLVRGRRTNAIFFSAWGTTEITNHIKTFGVTPKLAFNTVFFDIENRMIVGLDYYDHKDEILSGSPGPGKDMIVIEKKSLGLYVTDAVEPIQSIFVNAGFRSEWAYYDFDQQRMLAGHSEKTPYEYAWEAGLTYRYNDKSSIYANVSRSFRFPAVDEWYSALWEFWGLSGGGLNLGLAPQRSINYEVGVKEKSSKYVSAEAALFHMDMTNEIYFDPIALRNMIYEKTVHQGLEVEGHVYLFDLIDFFANYTLQKSYFVKGAFAGNEVPMVPRHTFSAGANLSFMESLYIDYFANFVGRRRFISDQRNVVSPLKAYITHNVRVSYRKHGLEIFASLNNIFNEWYSEYGVTNAAGNAQNFYPSPERNFSIGVSYKF